MEGARLGPYRLLAELGSGGMGRVYRAQVAGTVPGLEQGCTVALKVIHAHLLETEGFFKRFLREADIGRAIEHSNVVRTYDCDALLHEGTQQNFLVMEYVEGQTLREFLQELERVPEELCRHIGREVARGLAAIHEAGVVHRDLKPENVLITPDHVVKIMDLGVARLRDESIRLSQTGTFVGSLEYAAPEQFRSSDGGPDGRADLHALGVVLYEFATGQHPYRDEDAAKVLRHILDDTPRKAGELNPQLSPFFEELVHTLLAKDREDRFAAAEELAAILEQGEDSDWWRERAKSIRVETKRPLRRIRIPRETALYGRDDDLARMQGAFEKAKAGDGQVLLIEGEAGIGKTRLVDEFVGRLREEGEDVNFLFGSYPPGGAATATGAFSTAYREHFGNAGLADALSPHLSDAPNLVPSFAALLRGEAPPTGAEPLSQDALQTVFVRATRGLADERTTIVLIDDLHFAPEDGLSLFASLGLGAPEHRILLLGTLRPGVPEEWTAGITRLDHAEHHSVLRLGPKDLTKLLIEAFRSERLAEELAFRIAQKSDGNPFFAFEIIRGLREGQLISQRPDGSWVTTQVIKDIQVPSSVMDLVQARIADLDESERELLDVAACCGFEFDAGLVAAVLDAPLVPTLRRLAHLEGKHRLVRSSGRRFVFDHHQVQESLYRALPQQLREAYHAAIAETMESRAAAETTPAEDLDGALCVDLCEHFLEGALGRRALRYLDAGLDHLDAGYLNGPSARLARRALDVPDLLEGARRAGILLRMSAPLEALGRVEEEREALTEALALADAFGDETLRSRIHRGLGFYHDKVGDYDRGRAHGERALELARESGDVDAEGAATSLLGNVHNCLGDTPEAGRLYEDALELARTCGNKRMEASATGNLGNVYQSLGRFEEARVQFERSIALYQEAGYLLGEGTPTGNLGNVLRLLGRLEEARPLLARCLDIARSTGHRRSEGNATTYLGGLHSALGRYDEALEWHRRSRAICRELGSRIGEAAATGNMAVELRQLGRLEEARQHYEEALAIQCEIGARRGEASGRLNISTLLHMQGKYDEAREQTERAIDIACELGDRANEAAARGNLALLLRAEGRPAESLAEQERALTIAREIGYRNGEAIALLNMGSIWHEFGQMHRAREVMEAALEICREIGARRPEGYVLVGLARVADEEGDSAAALKLADESLAVRRDTHYASGIALSLALVGELRGRAGDHPGAREALEEALDHARSLEIEALVVDILVRLARFAGGDAQAALAGWETADPDIDKQEIRFGLWEVTRDRRHLEAAKRQLDQLVEQVPEEYRESMLKNVRLHREIMEAWAEHGGEEG